MCVCVIACVGIYTHIHALKNVRKAAFNLEYFFLTFARCLQNYSWKNALDFFLSHCFFFFLLVFFFFSGERIETLVV